MNKKTLLPPPSSKAYPRLMNTFLSTSHTIMSQVHIQRFISTMIQDYQTYPGH